MSILKNQGVFVIAELSANHGNQFDIAAKTIEAIANSGADAVKVQTYRPESLAIDVSNQYYGPIKEGPWKGLRPWDLYKAAAMPYEWQPKLKKIAEDLGLIFFSSPFDLEAVDFLEKINIPFYKIASFEINDIPLIKKVAKLNKPVIISTGVANESDIRLAIETCHACSNQSVILLKCTSEYPATIEMANLNTIPDMRQRFNVEIGLSDHTMGSLVPIVAVSLGATVVEKHFILDRSLGGPDSHFSMEPKEFEEMVVKVNEAAISLGKVTYDLKEKDIYRRRSLFAVQDIAAGDTLTSESIRSVRPGNGLSPSHYEEVLGCKAKVKIPRGTPLSWDLIVR